MNTLKVIAVVILLMPAVIMFLIGMTRYLEHEAKVRRKKKNCYSMTHKRLV